MRRPVLSKCPEVVPYVQALGRQHRADEHMDLLRMLLSFSMMQLGAKLGLGFQGSFAA